MREREEISELGMIRDGGYEGGQFNDHFLAVNERGEPLRADQSQTEINTDQQHLTGFAGSN